MSFFQNVFPDDFRGNLLLGDRQHIPEFICPPNAGRGNELVVSWLSGPYDLSGNDADGNSNANLTIIYALREPRNWASLAIDVTAGATSTAAVKPQEIAAALNANTLFAERFTASYGPYSEMNNWRVQIRQKRPITEFRFYIQNGGAEEKLGFNWKAGVAELPTYFARHTMENRFNFSDSQNKLIQLDPAGSNVDAAVITNAVDSWGRSLNLDSSTVQADWQLFVGKSGIFQFTKGPSTNAVSTTETVITYPAGAKAGDLGTKTITKKDASNVIVQQAQLPYTLTSGDLITP